MKTRITSYRNDIVIQKYLNGKTLDQIVKETNPSKGTVYNLVKRWKDKLGSIGIEEIREFATVASKSGMTIQQCAQGFRIVQILKELGINDEFEDIDDFAPEQDLLESIRNGTTDISTQIMKIYWELDRMGLILKNLNNFMVRLLKSQLLIIYYHRTPLQSF
jgi:hypothetical protein